MSPKTVLVVEDERSIREMMAFNLNRAGYAVERACDGRGFLNARNDRITTCYGVI